MPQISYIKFQFYTRECENAETLYGKGFQQDLFFLRINGKGERGNYSSKLRLVIFDFIV